MENLCQELYLVKIQSKACLLLYFSEVDLNLSHINSRGCLYKWEMLELALIKAVMNYWCFVCVFTLLLCRHRKEACICSCNMKLLAVFVCICICIIRYSPSDRLGMSQTICHGAQYNSYYTAVFALHARNLFCSIVKTSGITTVVLD